MSAMSDRETDSASDVPGLSEAAVTVNPADAGSEGGIPVSHPSMDPTALLPMPEPHAAELNGSVPHVSDLSALGLLEGDALADLSSTADHNVTFSLVDATEVPAGTGPSPSFDQEGVTLSLHDVLDIGTESIGQLQALVVTGDEGDVVRLQNDATHHWRMADGVDAPDGFIAYQAVTPMHSEAAELAAVTHSHSGADIYVLVQHDLQVLLGHTES